MYIETDISNNKQLLHPQLVQKTTQSVSSSISYMVLRYDQKLACETDTELGKYRCVVVNPETHSILGYFPPKPWTRDMFETAQLVSNYDDQNLPLWAPIPTNNIIITQQLEGIMVGLFYDSRIPGWQLFTRNSVEGNTWYYRRELANMGLTQKTCWEKVKDALRVDTWCHPLFQTLNKHICYHFILQHPNQLMVLPVPEPRLVLIGGYKLDGKYVDYLAPSDTKLLKSLREWDAAGLLHVVPILSEPPKQIGSVFPMGWVYTDTKTGVYMRIYNRYYENTKSIQLNHPNMQYIFYSLLRAEKTHEFTEQYPMYRKQFAILMEQYVFLIKTVHWGYMQTYVLKNTSNVWSKHNPYQTHIQTLHKDVYLPSLRSGVKRTITYNEVCKYFSAMEPKQLLFYMNYPFLAKLEG